MKTSSLNNNPKLPAIPSAWIVLILILITISCTDKPLYPLPQENKLVILAELTAGDSIQIPVTASLIAGGGNNISFEKVNDARVSLSEQGGGNMQLLPNNSPGFTNLPSAMYTHPHKIKPNTGYVLTAEHPLYGTATASVLVPQAFSVTHVSTDESSFMGREVLRFSFNISDPAQEKNYYLFEAIKQLVKVAHYFYWQGIKYDYDTQAGKDLFEQLEDEDEEVTLITDTIPTHQFLRLGLFATDPGSDNKTIGNMDSSFNRIFMTDTLFNGQSYPTSFAIATNLFTSATPEQKGIILVSVKSVSKEFYDYLQQYEKYKNDLGKMPVNQLSFPTENIQNGIGILGASFRNEWKLYYDDLE